MLRTISPAEMKRVENRVMQSTDITGEQLMQCAAAHVADAAETYIGSGVVLCLCGCGNNGGDGMAAMRILASRREDFLGECWVLPGRLSADAQRELDRLRHTSVTIREFGADMPALPAKVDCAIDALFGTGLCRPLEGLALEACRLLNALDAPVVAVDIPSGLHGDTGAVLGEAVQADCTVTFHRPKTGLFLQNGPDCTGKIIIGEIGIPAEWDDADGLRVLEKEDLARLLPKRRRVSHKGSYGRVLLVAGSRGMAGAAAIAATAALRTGAGLVTVACPECVLDIVQTLCPCATCLPLPTDAAAAWEMLLPALERADALGMGCGLGNGEWADSISGKVTEWLKNHTLAAVLDADALNLAAKRSEPLPEQIFITPHPAEAARLLHTTVADVLCDAPAAARKLPGCAMVKGTCTVMHVRGQMAINPFGTPAMAKGGSGDALTGIAAALLAGRAAGAYDMDDLALMQTACALHGLAGEKAQARYGERGVLATDLCECIGLAEQVENTNVIVCKDCKSSPVPHGVICVTVEHPAGSRDESDRRRIYPLNFGHVQQVLEENNEWQDACLLGVKKPLEWFEGEVSAVVCAGGRSIWCVSPQGVRFSRAQLERELAFLGTIERVEQA